MRLSLITNLDVCFGVDFMHGIAGCTAGFAIQKVALHEHRLHAQTLQPHIAVGTHVQTHTLADVFTVCE